MKFKKALRFGISNMTRLQQPLTIDRQISSLDKRIERLKRLLAECCPSPPLTFAQTVASLAATNELRGYWRLGEGISPFADTSGHTGGARDALVAGGPGYSPDVPGALVTDDDGAVRFNSLSGAGPYLDAADPIPRRFQFAAGENMTLAGWVKPLASTNTFTAAIVAQWILGGSWGGWGLMVDWPSRQLRFVRGGNGATLTNVLGPNLVADAWSFCVGTWHPTSGHKLYVNGSLVASDAAVNSNLPQNTYGPYIGLGENAAIYGSIDEVSVWAATLAAQAITDLYAAGT